MEPITTAYMAYNAGKEITKDIYALTKVLKTKEYGEAKVLLFSVVDFASPMRVDEWQTSIRHTLTNYGYKKQGAEYLHEGIVKISDIRQEYISLLPEETDEFSDCGTDTNVDNEVLYVKRARLYAIPESDKDFGIKNACLDIAKIAETYQANLNFKKTFTGALISFDDEKIAAKFATNLRGHDHIIQPILTGTTVQVAETSLLRVDSVFTLVDDELGATRFTKIKEKFLAIL